MYTGCKRDFARDCLEVYENRADNLFIYCLFIVDLELMKLPSTVKIAMYTYMLINVNF